MQNIDRSRFQRILLASASVSAIFVGSPALAQSADPQTNSAPVQTVAPVQAAPAQAEAPQAAPEQNTEADLSTQDIVVTAQFREQRLQDIPISITAVNAAQLEARSQTNLAQVADAAPNVSLKPQGASFGPSISASIRGVGQTDFNPAYEPGVGIYIDDVYYPQLTGAVFDLLDVDRVEILRGPQGTLAGRNSEGGAIKLYSRKPTGENGGFVEATYGSRNRIGLRAAADFKITDTLSGRLSGVFKQQEGFVDRIDYGCANPGSGVATARAPGDCTISKLGGVGYQAIRGILRWQPSDKLEVTLIGDYTHDEHTIAGEVLLTTATVNSPNTNAAPGVPYDNRFVCGPYCNYITTGQPAGTFSAPPVVPGANGKALAATSGTDRSLYDGWGVSGQINYNVNDTISLTSITGYRSFDTRFDSDDDLSPANIGFGTNHLTNWSFSQELRANAKVGDTINLTLGGYYFKQESVYDSVQDIRYVPVYPLQFRQPDPTNAEAKALFAHASWEPIENLTLSGGLRYTSETKDQTYYRLNYDGTINRFLDPFGATYGFGYSGPDTLDANGNGNTTETVTALSGLTAHYEAKRWDYRLAADYRLSDALLVYASFSTGFKGGGSNPRPFNANQVIPFEPEKLTAYEVGFKSDFFDRKMRFNVSAFLNNYKDIQIPVSLCPGAPCAARFNAGDARVKGFEAELTAFPVPGLAIDASLSYLDFHYIASSLNPLAAYPTNPGGVVADDPSGAPKWKFNAGAQYKIDLGETGSLTPRFDLNYQDKQYTGPTVIAGTRIRNFIPAYALLNARLTWQNADKDLEVSLEGTNITDKYYMLTIFDLRATGAGFRKGRPGTPREWALSVKKKF
ncbi:TonB-dependent receptor [Sphingomonas sp. So64.6b]|uniref:TonB-dependent receptor n=1 Tax=Sphingomonas sp. So64.6b TaxID=2997354 RepID=UPI001603E716|nr:TonB-dependent receptor [Sphingomonas sp. So64.6b]QNA84203.1 TonB-dependent receptor [Sphingomonas sp. So64.6b]